MSALLKFRAWDKKEKIMCEVGLINLGNTQRGEAAGCFLIGNSPTPERTYEWSTQDGEPSGHFVKMEDLELMAFTGMTDKNGKEIYEGDIISICNGSINLTPWMESNKEVVFKNGAFNVPNWTYDSTHWVEVICNIYENPELLK